MRYLLALLLLAGCTDYGMSYLAQAPVSTPPAPLYRIYPEAGTTPQTSRVLTAGDAATAMRAAVGLDQLDERQRQLCDTNGDGKLTAIDGAYLLREAVGIETMPVVERCGSHWIYWPTITRNGVVAVPPDTTRCQWGGYDVYSLPTPDADGHQHLDGLDFEAGFLGDCNVSWPGTVPHPTPTHADVSALSDWRFSLATAREGGR